MFDLKRLREAAMREGLKLASSPKVMRVLSSPRVMKVMMGALTLRGTVQHKVEERVQRLARSLNLATREDVRAVQTEVRDLEEQVQELQEQPAAATVKAR